MSSPKMRHARLSSYSEGTRTGARGATDKGHGVVTQGRHPSKPLRSRTRRRSVACLLARALQKQLWGPGASRQTSPTTPQGSALDLDLSPFLSHLNEAEQKMRLSNLQLTKPEGLLIERMAESRFKNILTG